MLVNSDGLVRSRVQHGFIGGFFVQDVLTKRQSIICRAALALAVGGKGQRHLAGSNALIVDNDRVPAVVDNLKGNALEVGITMGSAAGDTVSFLHSQTAANYIIHGGNSISCVPSRTRWTT